MKEYCYENFLREMFLNCDSFELPIRSNSLLKRNFIISTFLPINKKPAAIIYIQLPLEDLLIQLLIATPQKC